MPKVTIDGVDYVPKAEVLHIRDDELVKCLRLLTAIQYKPDRKTLHRDLAWAALCTLSPELGELSCRNPEVAYNLVRSKMAEGGKMPYSKSVELLAAAVLACNGWA